MNTTTSSLRVRSKEVYMSKPYQVR